MVHSETGLVHAGLPIQYLQCLMIAEIKGHAVLLHLNPVTKTNSEVITETAHLTLVTNDRTLDVKFQRVFGKPYLQIGNRWIRWHEADAHSLPFEQLPWAQLFSGELLLGNPELRQFLGIPLPEIATLLHPLPVRFESVVEKEGFWNVHYEPTVVAQARRTVESIDPFAQLAVQSLNVSELAQYLEAFVVLSAPSAGNSVLWDQCKLKLALVVGALSKHPVNGITPEAVAAIKIWGEKRKLGFNTPIMDLAATPEMREVTRSSMQNIGRIPLLARGKVLMVDPFNDGERIPRTMAPAAVAIARLTQERDYRRFVRPVSIVAGNATRIRDFIGGNKVTANIFELVEDAVDLVADALRERNLHGMVETIEKVGDSYYVSMLHILALMTPAGITVAGPSSIADVAAMLGEGNFLTQDAAHNIAPDGHLITKVIDVAGHGDTAFAKLANPETGRAAVRDAAVEVVQQGEYVHPALFERVAAQIVSGQTIMSIAVVPQPLNFLVDYAKLQADLSAGNAVELEIPGHGRRQVVGIAHDRTIDLAQGESFDPAPVRSQIETAWKPIQIILDEIPKQKTAQDQRDLMIKAMVLYDATINEPYLQKYRLFVTDGGKTQSRPIVMHNVNTGGMLAMILKYVTFVELSQFGSKHKVHSSDGTEHLVTKEAINAIYFHDFNLNFLGWCAFIVPSCLTGEAQQLYRDYRSALAQETDEDRKIALREEFAAKISAAIAPEKLSDEQWRHSVLMLEKLMTIILPPPTEFKSDFYKFNKMFQNVMTFFLRVAVSNITAEDLDEKELDRVLHEMGEAQTEDQRMAIRNTLRFKNGKTLQDLDEVPLAKAIHQQVLMILDLALFAQVKNPEQYPSFITGANESLKKLFGSQMLRVFWFQKGVTVAKEMESIRYKGRLNWVTKLRALKIPDIDQIAKRIAVAAKHEFDGGEAFTTEDKAILERFWQLVVFGISKEKWDGWIEFLGDIRHLPSTSAMHHIAPETVLPTRPFRTAV